MRVILLVLCCSTLAFADQGRRQRWGGGVLLGVATLALGGLAGTAIAAHHWQPCHDGTGSAGRCFIYDDSWYKGNLVGAGLLAVVSVAAGVTGGWLVYQGTREEVWLSAAPGGIQLRY